MITRGRQRIKQFGKAVTKNFVPSFRLGLASDYNGAVAPRTCTVTIGSSVLTNVRIMDHVLAPIADGAGVWVVSVGVGKNIVIGKVTESPMDAVLNEIIASKLKVDWVNQAGDLLQVGGDVTAARLRLTMNDDVSHTSTTHGLQIGPDEGANLRFDVNEILATSGGNPVTLYLQADSELGGDVGIGHGTAGSRVDICSQPFAPIGNNVTSGWTAASGWDISVSQCRRIGPMCCLGGQLVRTGSDITVNATGDLGNSTVATASGTPANGNSGGAWGVVTGSTGRVVGLTFTPSSGELRLNSIAPGANINTGNTLSFAGIIPVDVR